MENNNITPTLPAEIREEISKGERSFARTGRFEVEVGIDSLPFLPFEQKRQHIRDFTLSVIAEATKGSRGQPPMVERFRATMIIADWLRSLGVPFGVGPNSRMNKLVRKFLNELTENSSDQRKSRRKKITAGAVRVWLRQTERMKRHSEYCINEYPYSNKSPRGSRIKLPPSRNR